MNTPMGIEITGTGSFAPPNRVTNDELSRQLGLDTSDEWIRSHTGIEARHYADEDTASSDLALEASHRALEMAGLRPGELDLIILATTTADHPGCPSTACIVQGKLGAKNAAAMDVTACCSGFVYGLETAAALLLADANRKRALVAGADVLSRYVDWEDRSSCVLFGDAAGAVVIEKTAGKEERHGLLRSILRADGTDPETLIFRRGGSRNPYKRGETVELPPHLEMNGRAVYNFAVKAIVEIVNDLLEEEGLRINDVAMIIPHQANARIVQAAGKRLGFPEEKFFLNLQEYANTSAASIPLGLDELNRAGRLRRGDLILSVAFGGGLTYGGNLIIW